MEGFTLLELLVTVGIVALVSAAAVVAIPDSSPSRRLDLTSQRVLDEIKLAGLRARARGQVVRVRVSPRHLRFEYRDGTGWHPLSPAAGTLEKGIALRETHLLLRGPAGERRGSLLLFPDGSRTPFQLILRLGPGSRLITGGVFGAIRAGTGAGT